MYAAHCLELPKYAFYPTIFRYIFVTLLMSAVFACMNHFIATTSWGMVVADILLCGIVGFLLNFFLLFEARERAIFLDNIRRILHRV